MTDTLDRPPALVLDGDALDPIGGGGALVGYGRVSTKGQNLDRQMLALREAGCQKIFTDKKSGKNVERKELWECLDYLRPGDRDCTVNGSGAHSVVPPGGNLGCCGHQGRNRVPTASRPRDIWDRTTASTRCEPSMRVWHAHHRMCTRAR